MSLTRQQKVDQHLSDLRKLKTPEERVEEAQRRIKKEKDPEASRVLHHVLKYSRLELIDREFEAFLSKLRRSSRKQFSPEETSRLRADFEDNRSNRVRR